MIKKILSNWKIISIGLVIVLGGRWLLGVLIPTPAPAEREFTLVAQKFFYTPGIIQVNRGDHVTIHLVSQDVHHGFFLDGYEVQTSARPGEMGVVRFVADKPGRFSFRCSVTCGSFHPYMVGYLKVGPNTPFAGAIAVTLLAGIAVGVYLIRKTSGGTST